VEILERTPYAYRTSFPLDEARVRLPDGEEVVVLLKGLDRDRLDEATRRAKPAFVHDPRRERVVYEEVLPGLGLGTARYFGAVAVPGGGVAIALEKVAAVELWQLGELEAWERAARWAARLHRVAPAHARPSLLHYDATYFRGWLERASSFRGETVAQLARAHERALGRLVHLPRSFVHGELYASNVLVGSDRVCPIDWEMAGLGAAVLDLAAPATSWPGGERERLVAAYANERGTPVDDADLDAARLVLAVQWLGWSRDWGAPPEHATDWFAEAEDAARRFAS